MDDLISRQAAIDAAKAHWYKPDIVGAIEQLPSAQPERKTGEWGHTKTAFGIESHCPYCGWKYYKDMPFCAQCGAKMEVEHERD